MTISSTQFRHSQTIRRLKVMDHSLDILTPGLAIQRGFAKSFTLNVVRSEDLRTL